MAKKIKLEREVFDQIEGILNEILGLIMGKKNKKKVLANISGLFSLFDMYGLSALNPKLTKIESNIKSEKWTAALTDFRSLVADTLGMIQKGD